MTIIQIYTVYLGGLFSRDTKFVKMEKRVTLFAAVIFAI